MININEVKELEDCCNGLPEKLLKVIDKVVEERLAAFRVELKNACLDEKEKND